MNSLTTSINVPAATIATSGLTISTGVLTVAKNAAYTNQTISPNTTHALLGSFVLQNTSSSEAVRVTNYKVDIALTTADSTNLSNLVTDETSGSGMTPINPASTTAPGTSTNNFSVNFTLAPGATKTVNVYGDVGTATAGIVTVSLPPTAIGASSNVTVTPSATAGQTITIGSGSLATPTIVTSASTQSQYVAVGTTTGAIDATKAEFRVVASNGTATISELKFENLSGTSGAVTAVRVGSTTAPMVANVADLTGLALTVPNGGAGATIDAFASYVPADAAGTITGSTALLKLCYIKYTIGGTTTTSGTSSCGGAGTGILGSAVSSAQTMTLVGSKPTITVSQPTGAVLAVGAVEAIDVTVTADAAGPITIKTIPITSTITSGAFTTGTAFTVKDASNNTVALSSTSATGSLTGSKPVNEFTATTGGEAEISFSGGYLLAAGQSQTFKIFLPVATVSGSGALPNTFLYTSLVADGNFSWRDTAGNASSDQTGVTYVYNYPSTFTAAVHN